MATQEEIKKLKEIQERTTAQDIASKLKENNLVDKFVDKFWTQQPEEQLQEQTPEISIQDQQKSIQDQERERLKQERIASWDMKEEPTIKEPSKIDETWLPQNIQEWKEQWSDMTTLEEMIETKYNTVATQEDWKLKANIWWVDYEWNIDSAWNPIKTKIWQQELWAKDYLKQLIAWEDFTDPNIINTPQYKLAQKAYQKYDHFISLNEKQLSQALKEWSLLQGSSLFKILNQDPEFKNKVDKAVALNNINEETVDIETSSIEKTEEVLNEPTISNFMEDNNISAEEFSTLINTPEIVEQAEKVEKYAMKVNELQSTYDDIERATKEKYEWTWATRQDIASLVARRQEEQLPALKLAMANYNTAYGIYSDMKQDSIDLFNLNLWLYQTEQARTQALEDEQRQLQQQYAYTYWDLDSDDTTLQNIAIERAVWDMYSRYPIAWMESQAVKVQKVKDYMSWAITWTPMTASEAIAEVESEIRQSPWYEALTTTATETKTPNVERIWTDAEWNPIYWTYNQATWQYEPIGWASGAWTWTTWETLLTDFIKESEWFNNLVYDDMTWQVLAPWIRAKWTPTIWYWFTTVAWQPVRAWMQILENWDITDVNWNVISNVDTELKNQIQQHSNYQNYVTVPLSEAQQTALTSFEYNLWPNIWTWTWSTIIDSINNWDIEWAIEDMTQYNKVKNQETGEYEVMEWLNNRRAKEAELLRQWKEIEPLTDKQYTQYNQAYSKFVANPLVKSFEIALSSWWDLIASLKSDSWPWDVWAVFQFMKTLDPSSVVRESEFAVAKNTAWLGGKFKNLYDKVVKWEILTEEQRKAFWQVAFEYVKNKGKAYDIKYDDLTRVLKNQWISEDYYPSRMTDYIEQFEWWNTEDTTWQWTAIEDLRSSVFDNTWPWQTNQQDNLPNNWEIMTDQDAINLYFNN